MTTENRMDIFRSLSATLLALNTQILFYGRLKIRFLNLLSGVLTDGVLSLYLVILIENVILWVCYTIPFGFSLIRHFWTKLFIFLNFIVWLGITDEGSVPETRIWSVLLIKSDLKWCIYLSRSLFLYFNYLVSVTAGGPESPRGHM